MTPVARHRWIEVAAHGREAVAATAHGEDREVVRRWLARGLPLVARSRQPGEPLDSQPAGLSLCTPAGKVKIALQVMHAHIARIDEPPALDVVAAILPGDAAEVARELAAHALALGFTARAFGSAAWQWRSGDTYLHAGSDLDVLAAPPSTAAWRAWIERLQRAQSRMTTRIDGEIEAPGGDGINWRELAGIAGQLLVKSSNGARLAERAALERAWP